MRIAIISTSYPAFMRELYRSAPGLESKPYLDQLVARNCSLFGFADFYSRGFKAHGHEAAEFHLNNPWLQQAWAREHDHSLSETPAFAAAPVGGPSRLRRALAPLKPVLKPLLRRIRPPSLPVWQLDVLQSQIAAFRPDIIYNQEPAVLRGSDLKSLAAPGRRIIGQIASELPVGEPFRIYDLMISSLPNFVAGFRAVGVPAAHNRLAFDPSVREEIGTRKRDIPLSFVGNFSRVHKRRVALLEHVAARLPLKLWGTGLERLPSSSPLHRCFQGPAWGRTMLEILARTQITLNNHEAVSGIHANNLRLYEGTGMGSLLLTDHKSDLHDIFVPDEEVATYQTPDDCVRQIEVYLGDAERRERVAAAGLRRCREDHSYFRRTQQLLEIFRVVLEGRARECWLPSRSQSRDE